MRNKSPNAWWLKTTIHLFNVASNQLKVSWSRLGSEELLYYSVCFLCFSFDQWVSWACVLHRDSRVSREKKKKKTEICESSQSCIVLYCTYGSDQFSSVAQMYQTLCDPVDNSTQSFPVHHQLPELTQTHVHWVSDAIQPSHPLSSPSPPALNLSQHQGLLKWVHSSHQVAKALER